MTDVLAGLNPEQRRAAQYTGGPLLVLAGPGSGKTRVVTARIAHRIQNGVAPQRLLGITFTNRAAEEMKARVEALVGQEAPVRLGTFHWMCSGLLRRHIHTIGYRRDFRILDPAEARQVMRAVVGGPGQAGTSAALATAAVGAVKNGAKPEDVSKRYRLAPELISRINDRYGAQLRQMNAVDLDDLLCLSVRVLREGEDTRQLCRSLWDEILVDEYQDTNPIQRELLTLLAPASGLVVAVGDEDQAIYGWRQADVRNLLRFTQDFPGAEIVKLESTYRSTKHILRAAGALVAHNRERIGKDLRTDRPAGDRPICMVADDEVEEAEWIATEIRRLVEREGRAWTDLAVLYRVNAQSRAVEDALVRHAIPYRVLSGRRFYDRPEIRRVVAYLRLVVDPGDREAGRELLASVAGVGPKRLAGLERAAGPEGSILEASAGLRSMPGSVLGRLAELRSVVVQLQGLRSASIVQVLNAVTAVVERDLEALAPLQAEAARENLEELRTVVREFDAERSTLRAFLDRLALGHERKGEDGGVVLMSLHAAKGLEFPVVFMPGLEEGLLPHRRSLDRPEELEEERRLCYVGMTRAQDGLYLSYVHARMLGGQAAIGHASRFVGEIGRSNLTLRISRRARARPRLLSVKPGDRVRHSRWHDGTVSAVEGRGRETMVTIDFDGAGRQRLQLCYAPLSLIGEDAVDVLAG